jgi:hypothetical protein
MSNSNILEKPVNQDNLVLVMSPFLKNGFIIAYFLVIWADTTS